MARLRRALFYLFDLITFRNMPIRRKFTLFTLGVSLWYFVIAIAGIAHQPDREVVLGIVLALVIAHALLIAFAWTATVSLTRMIHAINAQVREITSGELTDLVHIQAHTEDELGELTMRFNGLLDGLRELATFKKVIEQDDSAQEVYGRLSRIFHDKGMANHQIFALDQARGGLHPVFETPAGPRWCGEAIADGAGHCRAFKTAVPVASESFPGICKLFDGDGCEHRCMPLIMGGTTGGVVQFVYGGELGPTPAEFKPRAAIAARFLHEALPVLEARRLTDTLRDSAVRDGLTGVHNRRFLEESHGQISALIKRRKGSLGVVMCDVDHFKRVNDEHGHGGGDLVLKEVAAALVACGRSSDMVIRYGGEEFLLLLHDTDRAGALLAAERTRVAVAGREVVTAAAVVRVTLSLGVAEFPADDTSLWEVIRRADEALYAAKRSGRNRVVAWQRAATEAEAAAATAGN